MMSSSPQAIAIAGVTGRLGSLIATYLLENTNCTVHGLCRSPEKVNHILEAHPTRFQVFAIDILNLEDARKGIAGCSTVICTYNKMGSQLMVDASEILIEACDAEGVHRFIPSDFTTDYRTIPVGDVPPKDPQIKIWKYLQDGNANGTIKVKAVHILVGLFAEAFYKFVLTPNNHKYWGTGNEPWELVTYESTAEYVAKVAADPECPIGVLKFCDYKATFHGIAAALGKIKGDGSPVQLEHQGTLAEAKEKIDSLKGKNINPFEYADLFIMYYSLSPQYQLGDQLDNYRYSDLKKTTTLEGSIKTYAN